MTCIVGIAQSGAVHLGGDSIAIGGYQMHTRTTPKVFRLGPYVIGCANSFRAADVVRYKFEPPIPSKDEDLHRFMACAFVDTLRATLKDNGVSAVENNVEDVELALLIGVRGALFTLDDDFHVGAPIGGFAAVGVGADVALGALHATREHRRPRHRLTRALEAAEAFCAGVRGPYNFVTLRR